MSNSRKSLSLFSFRSLLINFSYSPGHICFFESQHVYHLVSKFTIPPFHSKKHKCTPGRIGSVFFSPQKSLEDLQDKYPGWASEDKSPDLRCRA